MFFSKKGIMGMSISTVVMLVIAIFFVGAAIYFIRDTFPTTPPGTINLPMNPSAQDPLVLEKSTINIKVGTEETLGVGYYNRKQNTVNTRIDFGSCSTSTVLSEDLCDGNVKPIITSLEWTVEVGESAEFLTRIKASCLNNDDIEERLPPGVYICGIRAVDGSTVLEQKQIELTITT